MERITYKAHLFLEKIDFEVVADIPGGTLRNKIYNKYYEVAKEAKKAGKLPQDTELPPETEIPSTLLIYHSKEDMHNGVNPVEYEEYHTIDYVVNESATEIYCLFSNKSSAA